MLLRSLQIVSVVAVGSSQMATAQVDPSGDVLHLALSQSVSRQAPAAFSADLHLKGRVFLPTNANLSLGSAPTRLEGRNRSGQLFSSDTDKPSGLVQAESIYNQTRFQAERVEPSLLADFERFDPSHGWQIGGGGFFSYGCRKLASRIVIHCGPSFRPPREAFEGERCFGLLLRFDLGKRKPAR